MERAGAFHAPALALIHGQAFPAGGRWGADAIGLQLALPGAFGWIDAAGGMVLARVAADEAEILTLAVVPQARRQGLGGRLLRAAMADAALRGALSMVLEVASANTAALALYARTGFAAVGRRPGYYAAGEDAVIMRAELPFG